MTSAVRLVDQITGALAVSPGLTARQLIEAVGRTGLPVSKGEINSALYRERGNFWSDGASPPRWHLVSKPMKAPAGRPEPGSSRAPRSGPRKSEAAKAELYAWQAEALQSWMRQGRQGVIEAVTGTGKTMVGIAATIEALDAGGKVQIIVPTIELLRQWTVQLSRWLPPDQIGQLGDGKYADWKSAMVIVSVVNSARRYDLGPPGRDSLLVADECHRYGSGSNALALDERFARRLGLSATYGRADDGNAAYLEPYFGDTCFRMGYRRAIADEVTAHFKVALVGVPFAPGERDRYDEANRAAWEAQRWLIEGGHAAKEPFGEFMKDVSALAQGEHGRATWKARSFLSNFTERRRILAESPSKREHLARLLPALEVADRSIIFTQTVEAAEDAVSVIGAGNLKAEAIHSKMGTDDRRSVLARFASGQLRVISAPQVLDEGVDVPAADLAVILAASRTRRQMIQRMGRVLRRKDDGRLARFVVMYVEGSSEDPAVGAHADFLDDITDVADQVAEFKVGSPARDICTFLNDFVPGRTQGAPRMAPTPRPPVTATETPSAGGSAPGSTVAPERPVVSKQPASVNPARKKAKPAKAPPASGSKRPSSGDRDKTGGRPRVATGMNQKRLKRIYNDAGIAASKHRSEIGPVLYKLGHLTDEAIVHALRLSNRPDEVRALAENYTRPPTVVTPAVVAPAGKQPQQVVAKQKRRTTSKIVRGVSHRYCRACERLEVACTCGK